MFGLNKVNLLDDNLSVFVHVVASNDAFTMAQKLWTENVRLLHTDPANNKEFLRFTYAQPACNAWLQRDQGREGILELVVQWKAKESPSEVYVITPQLTGAGKGGNDERANAMLQAMLTTPSVVPAGSSK